MVATRKNLEDQVREIGKLIADANETLAQAQWARRRSRRGCARRPMISSPR
jgi:hypothetical protein